MAGAHVRDACRQGRVQSLYPLSGLMPSIGRYAVTVIVSSRIILYTHYAMLMRAANARLVQILQDFWQGLSQLR